MSQSKIRTNTAHSIRKIIMASLGEPKPRFFNASFLCVFFLLLQNVHSSLDSELPKTFFLETFDEDFQYSWSQSSHEKFAEQSLSWDKQSKVMHLDLAAKHYGIARLFPKPFHPENNKETVIQYDVKFSNGLDCGGAYIKLIQNIPKFDPEDLTDKTPYVIMFGPDKCGGTDKVHFIFQHQNPITKEFEEKHMISPPKIKSDKKTHLYTLVIRDDNSFEVFINKESIKTGNLLSDFSPEVNPPEMIDDPEDKKPSDWVDSPKIPDPNAQKPDDWDEDAPAEIIDEDDVKPDTWLDDAPKMIPDPNAQKPSDWDDDEDGEYDPPMIPNPECDIYGCGEWAPKTLPNPAYKGKWHAPMIDNPEYKGEWEPRKIPNPKYFKDEKPYQLMPIKGIAIEIWTMNNGIEFDNFLVGNSLNDAFIIADKLWKPKYDLEVSEEQEERRRFREEEQKKVLEEGFIGQVKYFFMVVGDKAAENVVISVIVGVFILLVPFALILRREINEPAVEPKSEEQESKEETETQEVETKAEQNKESDKKEGNSQRGPRQRKGRRDD